MNNDVIVIGGGISGLAAAVELSSKGYKVFLCEQKGKLGGRTYSYRDQKTGDIVDNGQHLLLRCYENTMRYLEKIGCLDKLHIQDQLTIEFLHPQKGRITFRCPNLPAPFHLLFGVLGLKTLLLKDRLRMILAAKKLIGSSDKTDDDFDSLTVDQWLTQLHQSDECKRYFWNVFAIAVLNNHPKEASAALFRKVLYETFSRNASGSSIMIPAVGLSELFVDGAVRYLHDHRGRILLNASVSEILFSRFKVKGVKLHNGHQFSAKAIVSAIPYFSWGKIFPAQTFHEKEVLLTLENIPSSPIITINVWLDREIIQEDFISLLGTKIQWVFNKNKIFKRNNRNGQYLSLVISGADEMISMSKSQLLDIAMRELAIYFPEAKDARMLHSLIIKEKFATFRSRPDINKLRPSPITHWENFFLAGDWIATGLPATIEGAISSGFRSAVLVEQYLHSKG